jgi:capsid protein
VGTGIIAKPKPANVPALALWRSWAETTACDADGRHDFYGLQKLVMSTVVESGEVLVRRRIRRPRGWPPDSAAAAGPRAGLPRHEPKTDDAAERRQHRAGRRVRRDRPPRGLLAVPRRTRLEPADVRHDVSGLAPRAGRESPAHFQERSARPGARASWFAPVLLRFKDFDEFEDATLMKQKIAACLAVITSDIDGSARRSAPPTTPHARRRLARAGRILNVPPGRNVEVVQPPSVATTKDYCGVTLRAIATGLGVAYEDLTGDYTNLPFSAARMSRLRHWARVTTGAGAC